MNCNKPWDVIQAVFAKIPRVVPHSSLEAMKPTPLHWTCLSSPLCPTEHIHRQLLQAGLCGAWRRAADRRRRDQPVIQHSGRDRHHITGSGWSLAAQPAGLPPSLPPIRPGSASLSWLLCYIAQHTIASFATMWINVRKLSCSLR